MKGFLEFVVYTFLAAAALIGFVFAAIAVEVEVERLMGMYL